MATAVICGILILICFAAVKSTVKRVAHGCCGTGGDTVKKIKVRDRDLSHYPYTCTIEVEGMTCSNCKNRVENAFNEQEGVYAEVNLKKKTVQIHTKEPLAEDEIRRTILRSGYEPGAYYSSV